jgi:hypothetical protein
MLLWLESTGLSLWLRESPSVWSLPTVLTLHTMGMGVLVGASWMLDLRVLGINRHVPLANFRWVFPVVGIGLSVNLITGVLLFIKNPTTWGSSIPFLIKMGLVIASVATLLPLRALVRDGAAEQLEVGSTVQTARVWAIVSILAWSGAVTAGRLLAYVQP